MGWHPLPGRPEDEHGEREDRERGAERGEGVCRQVLDDAHVLVAGAERRAVHEVAGHGEGGVAERDGEHPGQPCPDDAVDDAEPRDREPGKDGRCQNDEERRGEREGRVAQPVDPRVDLVCLVQAGVEPVQDVAARVCEQDSEQQHASARNPGQQHASARNPGQQHASTRFSGRQGAPESTSLLHRPKTPNPGPQRQGQRHPPRRRLQLRAASSPSSPLSNFQSSGFISGPRPDVKRPDLQFARSSRAPGARFTSFCGFASSRARERHGLVPRRTGPERGRRAGARAEVDQPPQGCGRHAATASCGKQLDVEGGAPGTAIDG